jgi:endonuclease/exonuclease/phosphatase family metal-dependent hydrolase
MSLPCTPRIPSIGRALLLAAALVVTAPPGAATERLRLATYNVLDIEPGTGGFDDLVEILGRTGPDVVLLQEVGDPTQSQSQSAAQAQVNALATAAGYPFKATSQNSSGLGGDLRVAVLSKWQITSILSFHSNDISPDPNANDIGRDILRVTVAVPDVSGPVAFFNVHQKAGGGDENEFRRAIEGLRLRQLVEEWCASNPSGHAFVGGDFNADVGGFSPQSFSFSDFQQLNLPFSFDLGSDVQFPVLYDPFGQLQAISGCATPLLFADATAEDSTTNDATFQSGSRLDYLFASTGSGSDVILLADEVYRSPLDDDIDAPPAGQYLRKFGSDLASNVSSGSSDHFPVIADYLIEGPDGFRLGFNTPGQYALAPFAGYGGTMALGASDFTLRAFQARPNQLALAFQGALQFPAPDLGLVLPNLFAPGTFFYAPTTNLLGQTITDERGDATLAVPIPNLPSLAGKTITTQWVILDPLAAGGLAVTSDAYLVQL